MDSSVQLEQVLMEKIQALQARVLHLEQAFSSQHQAASNDSLLIPDTQPLTSAPQLLSLSTQSSATPSVSTMAASSSSLLGESPVWTLDAVFETITDGLAIYDGQGNIVRANAAFHQMIGDDASKQSMLTRASTLDLRDENDEIYSYDMLPLTRLLTGETMAGDTVAQVAFLNPEGFKIKVDISGSPIRDAHGMIVGAVAVLRDVTERRNQEQGLRDANQRMDEFLSIASHELRTPLTTINGNIQLARRRVQSLATQFVPTSSFDDAASLKETKDKFTLIQELLSRAERQVHIQNRLVNELLDVSRIQSNRLELHVLPCDLAVIVRDAVNDQLAATPDRTITLAHLPADATIPIHADADRVAQVVTNLLTNALKYSTSDQPIEVFVDCSGEEVRVSVHDHGPGIPLEAQARLWERFYRVPGVTVLSGSGVGLGLGLYICRTIIEGHNGQIGVQSMPGVGSTFWFSLSALP